MPRPKTNHNRGMEYSLDHKNGSPIWLVNIAGPRSDLKDELKVDDENIFVV